MLASLENVGDDAGIALDVTPAIEGPKPADAGAETNGGRLDLPSVEPPITNPREAAKRAALAMMASGDPKLERLGHVLFAELLAEEIKSGDGGAVVELADARRDRGDGKR